MIDLTQDPEAAEAFARRIAETARYLVMIEVYDNQTGKTLVDVAHNTNSLGWVERDLKDAVSKLDALAFDPAHS
jgi:hypothetical protein